MDLTLLVLPRRRRRWTGPAWRLLAAGAAVVCVLTASSAARCQTAPDAPRRVLLEHDGAAGVWFRMDVARALLADVEEAASLRVQVGLLGDKSAALEGQVDLYRGALAAEEEASAASRGALEAAERGRRLAEDRLGAWYRSPVLWLAVGVACGAAVVLVVD